MSSLFNFQFFAIGNNKGNIGNKKTAKLLGAKNANELIQIKCTTAGNQPPSRCRCCFSLSFLAETNPTLFTTFRGGGLTHASRHFISYLLHRGISDVEMPAGFGLGPINSWVRVACVAGVKRGRGRGNLGARERVGRGLAP